MIDHQTYEMPYGKTHKCKRFQCHPKINISAKGPVVDNKPLHLRQSDLDSACGVHCVLMSLLLLGLAKHKHTDDLPESTDKRLATVWLRAVEYHFSGTHPKELRQLYEPYKQTLLLRFAKKAFLQKAVDCLHRGGVCIVGISNDDLAHWVLIVGVSYNHEGKADGFLILDPSEAAIPLTAWNARLSFPKGEQESYLYEVALGRAKVAIDTMLTITLRNPQ